MVLRDHLRTQQRSVTFKEFSRDQAEAMLALITEFDFAVIAPDAAQIQRAFDWTLRLRRAAAYDSFYLALAETTSDGLWTADERLVQRDQVARALGTLGR